MSAVPIIDSSHGVGDPTLHVDHFGLSIGPISVGLPTSCTSDMVLVRYLDLLRLVQRGPRRPLMASPEDLVSLAEATGLSEDHIVSRLRALQT